MSKTLSICGLEPICFPMRLMNPAIHVIHIFHVNTCHCGRIQFKPPRGQKQVSVTGQGDAFLLSNLASATYPDPRLVLL